MASEISSRYRFPRIVLENLRSDSGFAFSKARYVLYYMNAPGDGPFESDRYHHGIEAVSSSPRPTTESLAIPSWPSGFAEESLLEVGDPVFTIGYQGRSLQEFCQVLVTNEISVVVDVRLTPWSRRPGFAKTALSAALAQAGVRYVHEPTLGNPKENRESFQLDDPEPGRAAFRTRMLGSGLGALRHVASLMKSERTALLCMESDDARCHRQVIVDALLEMEPTMRVTPL